jgi:DNA polymerase-4
MIIHIDIDCFFVSALRIKEPALRGLPVAIGGRSDTKIFDASSKKQVVNFDNSGSFVPTFYKDYERSDNDIKNFLDSKGNITGILTTASYEAREYGVRTAMRIAEALKLCPNLIIKSPNMSLYQKLSHQLYEYLSLKIPVIEQASIDEFYGDLDGWIDDNDVKKFICDLKASIKEDIKLPVSIGASYTRFYAKLATNFAKPYGCKILNKLDVKNKVYPLDISLFPGIGKRTQDKLYNSGIYTIGDIIKRKERVLALGPYAKNLYKKLYYEIKEPLNVNKKRKSIGISRSIEPLYDREELKRRIKILSRHLCYAVLKLGVMPTVYHLGLKYEMNKKSYINKSSTVMFNEDFFYNLVSEMLKEADIYKRYGVIRISLHCSSFTRDSKKELDIISYNESLKQRKLSEYIHKVRDKYGLDLLKRGSEL